MILLVDNYSQNKLLLAKSLKWKNLMLNRIINLNFKVSNNLINLLFQNKFCGKMAIWLNNEAEHEFFLIKIAKKTYDLWACNN